MIDNLSELRTYLTKNMFLKPVDSNICEVWHNRYSIMFQYNKIANYKRVECFTRGIRFIIVGEE